MKNKLFVMAWLLLGLLFGCSSINPLQRLEVKLVGLEPLAPEGTALRVGLKLRVHNPNVLAIDYQGIALQLEMAGQQIASGNNPDKGTIARDGDTLVTVPVSIAAGAALRQGWDMVLRGNAPTPFVLRGNLGGTLIGTVNFENRGEMNLSRLLGGP